ncbi:hypothetical protein NC653_002041 [Populus alba x Populus x berolinensis]|uniref:Uncharacterized protein n=1 Tax=Populus alba x Populus x berolinensis TaxID=444605 RepID=A0AAD6RMQ6_9ROSI|nr:hypothetical protein NC653_002041 [Populus alba x Populus x berolinensis]
MLPQVKAAHQFLKTIPHSYGSRRVDGVPVFSKQNLDIVIVTKNEIKWYPSFGCSCEHDVGYIQLTFQGIGLFFSFLIQCQFVYKKIN